MFIHKAKLQSEIGTSYDSVEAWTEAHGPSGLNHDLVLEGELELDGTGVAIRTLKYATAEDRQAHVDGGASEEEKKYITETISTEEI